MDLIPLRRARHIRRPANERSHGVFKKVVGSPSGATACASPSRPASRARRPTHRAGTVPVARRVRFAPHPPALRDLCRAGRHRAAAGGGLTGAGRLCRAVKCTATLYNRSTEIRANSPAGARRAARCAGAPAGPRIAHPPHPGRPRLLPVIGPFRFERGFLAAQPPLETRRGFDLSTSAKGTFPDNRYTPALFEQLMSITPVPLHVGTKFRLPEFRSGGWRRRVPTARVAVPEAPVNEADRAEPAKHQVRRSRKAPIVQAIPDPSRMQGTAKEQFRYSVPASDSCHHSGASRSIHYVRHLSRLHRSGGVSPAMDFTGGSGLDQGE